MINVFLYIIDRDKAETNQVIAQLSALREEIPHHLAVINIEDDLSVYQAYQGKTPVLEVGAYHLYFPYDEDTIRITLVSARDRQARLLVSDPKYANRLAQGKQVTNSDRFGRWLTKHYMSIINIFLLIYLGLPFLAPVFQKIGLPGPAKVIHAIYSPLCHQLAYRSWFMFGEQAAYPRELAGTTHLKTYEEVTGLNPHDLLSAKAFKGNEELGYKVAYCERDVAIYGGMLLFSIFFTFSGRKLKAIPWYVWLVAGILPIGFDGVSQLPALLSLHLTWLPVRESTPLLRTATGMLFGITTAWYGLPLFEETMRESKAIINKRFALQNESLP